jgi:hypothetical protein
MAVVIGAGVALIAVGDLGGVVLVVFGLVFAALSLPRPCPPRRPHQDEE